MTIRLRPAAAAALNSTLLYQRMHVNPRLSYPEFASEIVQMGLAAFERQAKQLLPAVARAGYAMITDGSQARPQRARILPQRLGSSRPAGLSPMGDIGVADRAASRARR
jgi:hypothetical protein